MQKIYIKNMVCARCVRVVKEELDSLGIDYESVSLGEAVLKAKPSAQTLAELRTRLGENGFELIDDPKTKLIEEIKTLVIEAIYNDAKPAKMNFSKYLSEKTHKPYTHLSSLFSSVENITIEKYIILQKIERVKELIVYGELSLGEIAFLLGYSSTQHLSNQFKQVTGLTPSYYRELKENKRKSIDNITLTKK